MLGLIKKDLIIMVKRMNPIQLIILLVVVIPISQFPQYTLISISLVISYLASILVSTSSLMMLRQSGMNILLHYHFHQNKSLKQSIF